MHRKTLTKPRYWIAKLNNKLFTRRFPHTPWLTEAAIYLLEDWLRPTDQGIEWGAGRSTIWFASRIAHLTSIESSHAWYNQTKKKIHDKQLQEKIDLHFIPVDDVNDYDNLKSHPYSDIVCNISDEYLDFALVDGIKLRVLCMEKVISKIKPGGLLILDNAERFLPNNMLGEHTVAITPRDICLDERWRKLFDVLNDWRSIYTTNGISDTRFWVKPA